MEEIFRLSYEEMIFFIKAQYTHLLEQKDQSLIKFRLHTHVLAFYCG